MLLLMLTLAGLVLALTPHIHRVILTFRKPVILGSVMGDNSAKHSTGIVLRDTADNDSVSSRRAAVVTLSVPLDGEFEIRLLSVFEAEVFVVVVRVRVLVAAQSLVLRG